MAFRNVTYLPRAFLAAIAFGAISVCSTGALAACSPGAAAPQKISDFIGNPSSLLNGPSGPRTGDLVTSDVRDLILSDPATLPLLIAMLKAVPPPGPDVQRAIGAGLGLAANMCIRQDPTFAAEIQTQLAGTDSVDAKQQYAAITGNILIGSVGGGAGGVSSGAVGGQVTTFGSNFNSAGSFQPFVANSVTSPSTNFFGGGTSGGGTTSSTTTTTVNGAPISVSPSGL